jgi:hypothetical protein
MDFAPKRPVLTGGITGYEPAIGARLQKGSRRHLGNLIVLAAVNNPGSMSILVVCDKHNAPASWAD